MRCKYYELYVIKFCENKKINQFFRRRFRFCNKDEDVVTQYEIDLTIIKKFL